MSKANLQQFPFNPFAGWCKLACSTGEMMLASAHVISHRTGRIAKAGPFPGARDRREFSRMVSEKIDASVESGQRMGLHLMQLHADTGALTLAQLMAGTSAAFALAGSRTPQQVLNRQAAFVRAMTAPLSSSLRWSNHGATLAQHGLRPIHARALANAKRLRRL